MAKFSQVENTTEKPNAYGSGRPGEKRVPTHVTEVSQLGTVLGAEDTKRTGWYYID